MIQSPINMSGGLGKSTLDFDLVSRTRSGRKRVCDPEIDLCNDMSQENIRGTVSPKKTTYKSYSHYSFKVGYYNYLLSSLSFKFFFS